jgi:hypothetical protein
VNVLDPISVKCQERFSRTIQWMSIPLAGVRHELSAHAGLVNKLDKLDFAKQKYDVQLLRS